MALNSYNYGRLDDIMQLFTEIYNCYYQIVDEICKAAQEAPISEKDMLELAARFGYEESGYLIVPKLINHWKLLEKTEEGYYSKIDNLEVLPLTTLQKRWLKAILLDKRVGLFLNETRLSILNAYLSDVEPLFYPEDFHYYDRFQDGDDFAAPEYVAHFRLLLEAIRSKRYVEISFCSRKGADVRRTYLPCRMEYSAKNDKFRLLVIPTWINNKKPETDDSCNAQADVIQNNNVAYSNLIVNEHEKERLNRQKPRVEIVNLSRIETVTPTDRTYQGQIDLEQAIKASYYKEPVKLLITTKRNTLERTMLHFASYEKQTRKLDEDTYECLIYYNSMVETELLIEILSFGPTVKVLGPENFVERVKQRLGRQVRL